MVSPGKKGEAGSPTLAAQVLPFKGSYCEEEQQNQQLHRASWAERRKARHISSHLWRLHTNGPYRPIGWNAQSPESGTI